MPGLASDAHMLSQQRLDAVRAELASLQVGEQGAGTMPRRLIEPSLKCDSGVSCQRGTSLFAAFTHAPDMRTDAEMNGFPAQADQLGEAQARLGRKQQKCVVTAAQPRRPIGRSEDGFDLGTRQEIHLTLVVSRARYREYALNEGAVSRWRTTTILSAAQNSWRLATELRDRENVAHGPLQLLRFRRLLTLVAAQRRRIAALENSHRWIGAHWQAHLHFPVVGGRVSQIFGW